MTVARLDDLLDDAAVELRLPGEYEVSSDPLFAAARFRSTTVSLVLAGLFLVLASALFIVTFGPPDGPVWIAGIPLPFLLLGATGGAFMLGLWLLPVVRPSLRRLSRTIDRPIFVVGSTPFSRRLLLITRGGILLLDGRGGRLGSWPHDQVQVTALGQFANAVALLIATEDRFFELPISHAVGGPAAPMWSNGGAIGLKDLRKLISRQLAEAAYTRVDDSLIR
ncbi:hypothetical protein [Agromyces sp. GXS1127]|uniref:hypothetical protein n=1 Tax=Agromyces sp. GXS1127 TaxID=3424181 RepID=UPI003D317B9A